MDEMDTPAQKPGPVLTDEVCEVEGIFPSDAALQDAIGRLTMAGFDRADLSLPDASPAPEDATPDQGAAAANTDTDRQQMRTLHTGLASSVGVVAGAAAVAATGGAAIPIIGAAVGAGIAAGAISEGAAKLAGRSGQKHRQDAAQQGTLVLAVHAVGDARRGQAEEAMRAAGASRVEYVKRVAGGVQPMA